MYKLRIHSGGGTTYDFMCGLTEEEAIGIGNSYKWRFLDENEFCWDMDYDEDDGWDRWEIEPSRDDWDEEDAYIW